MEQSFTQNQLLEFIYGERPLKDYADLDDAFCADPALRYEFRMLYDSYAELPVYKLNPRNKSIQDILSYSKT